MTPRRRTLLIAWLLPLLCLRALLPTGFMLSTDTGLSMVLCSGGFYKTLSASSDEQPGAPAASADTPCLFALAATTGPTPTVIATTDFVPHAVGSLPPFQLDHFLSRPLIRAQQSRAPPSFLV